MLFLIMKTNLTVKKSIEKLKSKQLLKLLNKVHSYGETSEDTALREKAIRYYAKKVLKVPQNS